MIGTAKPPPFTLVCFAVKEEAKYLSPPNTSTRLLLTGMGRENARRWLEPILARDPPVLVLSCGFAGGLKEGLERGTVLFDADSRLAQDLKAAGAEAGRFYCAAKVATTAEEKRELREATGADAVEMESEIIRQLCRERGIPSATVRVILDTAEEDLPLDFNALMTADQQLDSAKLARTVLGSPGKIPGLLRLQRQSVEAAKRLAQVLTRFLTTAR